jgi:hypothetical protein
MNTKNRIIDIERPNQLWEVDLICRIQDKHGGNKFIFVAIDHFTKWIETVVLLHKDSQTTLAAVQQLIIDKNGITERILTDNGLEFDNKSMERLCKEFGIKCEFSSFNHHQRWRSRKGQSNINA